MRQEFAQRAEGRRAESESSGQGAQQLIAPGGEQQYQEKPDLEHADHVQCRREGLLAGLVAEPTLGVFRAKGTADRKRRPITLVV